MDEHRARLDTYLEIEQRDFADGEMSTSQSCSMRC